MGVPSPSYGTMPEVGIMARMCLAFPTHLDVGIFSFVDVEESLPGLDLLERNAVYAEHR